MGDFKSMFEKNILNLGLARLENYGTVRYGQGDKFGRTTVTYTFGKIKNSSSLLNFNNVT